MSAPSFGAGAPIDLARFIESRLLLVANSGAGKSWALRRLLEQTHGKVQQIIIDPEGEFFTLREKLDYVLVAKNGGDAVADPKLADLLALRLLELEASAILDISELEAHDRIRFVRRFLEKMVNAPRVLWHPVLVVIDEAHAFAPQKGESESAKAVIDLCVRGRKRGFCAVLATQRLSKLSKDAAAELLNKLVGRTSLDVDLARAGEELGLVSREERLALRILEPGSFYAYGPALSSTVQRIEVGPVRTTHPQAGGRLSRQAAPPPTDAIRKLLPKLADLPKEALEQEAEVETLRRAIGELRAKLATAARPAPSSPVVDRRAIKALEANNRANDRAWRALCARAQAEAAKTQKALGPVVEALARLERRLGDLPALAPTLPGTVETASVTPTHIVKARMEPFAQKRANGLSMPEVRVLDAIAWLEVLGEQTPDKRQVAAVARYSSKSGGFRNILSMLRTASLIEYGAAGRVFMTDDGRAKATYPSQSPTGEELRSMALEILGEPEQRVLLPLLIAFPEELDREALAAKARYQATSGGFRNLLSKLRTLGFIEYRAAARVAADPILFPDRGGSA